MKILSLLLIIFFNYALYAGDGPDDPRCKEQYYKVLCDNRFDERAASFTVKYRYYRGNTGGNYYSGSISDLLFKDWNVKQIGYTSEVVDLSTKYPFHLMSSGVFENQMQYTIRYKWSGSEMGRLQFYIHNFPGLDIMEGAKIEAPQYKRLNCKALLDKKTSC